MLIEAGVVPRTVVDIDILRDAVDLKKLMEAYGVDDPAQAEILELRSRIAAEIEDSISEGEIFQSRTEAFRKLAEESATLSKGQLRSKVDEILGLSKWSALKKCGIATLSGPAKEEFQELLNKLTKRGIDIVPVGELESWIELGRSKGRWVEPALEIIYAKQAGKPLEDFVERILQPVTADPGAATI
ncbi:hypothetical protein GCM10027088_07180 [Nocardia goodfellowii]